MKTCTQCSSQFEIRAADKDFYARVKAPEPSVCPSCRLQKRMAYRNERTLYPTICGLCQKQTLSMYNAEHGFTVYCSDCWWSDKWDPTDYGQEIDWSRPLLDQWNEVRKAVPRLAMVSINSENSEYTNISADIKDSYLLFAAEECENCSYGKFVHGSKDCFDCNFVKDSELCYQCVGVRNCYNCVYLMDSTDSRDSWFSVDIKGCSNVFLSSNQRNAQYVLRNEQLTKEEYEQQVAELTKDYDSFQACVQEWYELLGKRVVRDVTNINSPESTGDYLNDCKRAYNCFDVTGGQDIAYITDALDPKDSQDASFIYYDPQLVYDCMSMLQPYNVQYSVFVYYTQDSQYCDQVHNSNKIMLSSCVRKQEYMILNKKYSAEEYEELLPKVIAKMQEDGEYGELPGMEHSLFAYNDTVAYEYFPLTKEQAIEKELRWNDESDKPYTGDNGMSATDLPQRITDCTDDILNTVIVGESSGKAYRINAKELEFYRQMGLPLPRLHPETRHRKRMALRNPRQLFERTCTQCNKTTYSTFAEGSTEKLLCSDCYREQYT